MCNSFFSFKSITLAYFSGTGCTKTVADCFERQLVDNGVKVKKINVANNENYDVKATDMLLIVSPVYAFRLTSVIEKWTKNLPNSNGTYAAIISVSGGGEISPNTACRTRCKRFLKRKNYELIYEKMLVMPSNFAIQAEEQLNHDLINILPKKVDKIISDMIAGKKNITHPKLQDRIFVSLGKAEHFGASMFGVSIHATNECNQCGLCIRNCPKKNIRLKNGKPKFGFNCMWCMKCLYSCPSKALSPRILKCFVLRKGFDIKKMTIKANQSSTDQVHTYSKNILWQGAIDYLKED
jgi:ferredoxin